MWFSQNTRSTRLPNPWQAPSLVVGLLLAFSWVTVVLQLLQLYIVKKTPECEELRLSGPEDTLGAYPVWSSPLEFLASCDELVAGVPFPADHNSKLGPLFAHNSVQTLSVQSVVTVLHKYDKWKRSWKQQDVQQLPCQRWSGMTGALAPLQPSKLCIGIVMINTDETAMSKHSIADKQSYATQHGYGFHVFGRTDVRRKTIWSKFPAFLTVSPMYDWIWTVDVDTLIMNATTKLESFVDNRYEGIFAVDTNGINLGSFFIKTSTWGRLLVAEAYSRTYTKYSRWYQEQAAMTQLSTDFRLRNKMKIVPNSLFDVYYGGKGGNHYHEGDFVLHFPGTPSKTKEENFFNALKLRDSVIPT